MVKPRSKTAPATEPDQERDPDPTPAGESEGALGYRESAWAGAPNYVCEKCPFATLDPERISAHVAHSH